MPTKSKTKAASQPAAPEFQLKLPPALDIKPKYKVLVAEDVVAEIYQSTRDTPAGPAPAWKLIYRDARTGQSKPFVAGVFASLLDVRLRLEAVAEDYANIARARELRAKVTGKS